VTFDNLKVGEDVLVEASFFGPVRWDYGEAKGIYFSSGVSPNVQYYRASRFFNSFCFDSNRVSNSVSFQDADFDRQFVCRENKTGDDLNARDAYFKSIEFLSKSQTTDGSGKQGDLDSRFDVDLSRTKVGGIARFNGARFDGCVSFERIDVRDLDITSIKLPEKKVRLT